MRLIQSCPFFSVLVALTLVLLVLGYLRWRGRPSTPTTVVLMRSTYPNVKYWTSRVQYDAWSQPYAKNRYESETLLLPNGKCDSAYTEWRYERGPEIVFPEPRKEW